MGPQSDAKNLSRPSTGASERRSLHTMPPDVWAAFLCITPEWMRANFCYQAFTLRTPVNECYRDVTTAIRVQFQLGMT